jgi:hypothetical protein
MADGESTPNLIAFPNSATPQQREECQLAIGALEQLAASWCKEARVEEQARHLASICRLSGNASQDVREQFIARQEKLIARWIEQAWIEGAMCGSTGAFDLMRAGYVPKPNPSLKQGE